MSQPIPLIPNAGDLNTSAPGLPVPKIGTLIPNRIFVGGISSNTTEDELRTFFSVFGPIKDVKVIYDKSGLSKGSYGFVTFEEQTTADNIIKNESGFCYPTALLITQGSTSKHSSVFTNSNTASSGENPVTRMTSTTNQIPSNSVFVRDEQTMGPIETPQGTMMFVQPMLSNTSTARNTPSSSLSATGTSTINNSPELLQGFTRPTARETVCWPLNLDRQATQNFLTSVGTMRSTGLLNSHARNFFPDPDLTSRQIWQDRRLSSQPQQQQQQQQKTASESRTIYPVGANRSVDGLPYRTRVNSIFEDAAFTAQQRALNLDRCDTGVRPYARWNDSNLQGACPRIQVLPVTDACKCKSSNQCERQAASVLSEPSTVWGMPYAVSSNTTDERTSATPLCQLPNGLNGDPNRLSANHITQSSQPTTPRPMRMMDQSDAGLNQGFGGFPMSMGSKERLVASQVDSRDVIGQQNANVPRYFLRTDHPQDTINMQNLSNKLTGFNSLDSTLYADHNLRNSHSQSGLLSDGPTSRATSNLSETDSSQRTTSFTSDVDQRRGNNNHQMLSVRDLLYNTTFGNGVPTYIQQSASLLDESDQYRSQRQYMSPFERVESKSNHMLMNQTGSDGDPSYMNATSAYGDISKHLRPIG